MSEDQEPVTLHDLTELSREKLGLPKNDPFDPLATAASYIRANPWAAVGSAALLGMALVSLSRRRPEPRKIDVIRDWLDHAQENLPSRREVASMAESTGVPGLLKRVGQRLHLIS